MGALITEVIHDGDDNPITGGVRQWDTSGTGVGPNMPIALLHGIYDTSPPTFTDGGEGQVLIDSNGRLIVTNNGTFPIQIDGAALTSLQLLDDAVKIDNDVFVPDTSKGFLMMGGYQSTPSALANNDAGIILIDSNHRLVAAPSAAQLVDDDDWSPGTSSGVAILGVHDALDTTRTPTSADVAAFSLDPNANQRVVLPSTRSFPDLTSTFNRPANTTAYTANDAVNDNATAGGGSSTLLSWTIPKSRFTVTRVRIRKSDQTVATPTIRVWFYSSTITMSAGDNEAFTHPVATCIGFVDVSVTTAGSDDAAGWASCSIGVTVATLKGQLQTLSAFTPASGETFTIDLEGYPG